MNYKDSMYHERIKFKVFSTNEIKNEPGAVPNSFYPRSLNEMTVSKFKESLQNI